MGKLQSIFNYTCPRCRQSKFYIEPFEISKPVNMKRSCEVCGLRFEPEPGFYFGAMFISYIFSGWVFVGTALILVFVAGMSLEAAMGIVIVIALLTFFKLMRLSRSLWLHLMVKYDPKYKTKNVVHESKNP